MKWRAHSIVVLASALLAGCTTSTPCDGQLHGCVNTTVDSNLDQLDQLVFRVDQPRVERLLYPLQAARITFPLQLALIFPSGTTRINVVLEGWRAYALVGFTAGLIDIPPVGVASTKFTIGALPTDAGATGDAAAGDLAH